MKNILTLDMERRLTFDDVFNSIDNEFIYEIILASIEAENDVNSFCKKEWKAVFDEIIYLKNEIEQENRLLEIINGLKSILYKYENDIDINKFLLFIIYKLGKVIKTNSEIGEEEEDPERKIGFSNLEIQLKGQRKRYIQLLGKKKATIYLLDYDEKTGKPRIIIINSNEYFKAINNNKEDNYLERSNATQNKQKELNEMKGSIFFLLKYFNLGNIDKIGMEKALAERLAYMIIMNLAIKYHIDNSNGSDEFDLKKQYEEYLNAIALKYKENHLEECEGLGISEIIEKIDFRLLEGEEYKEEAFDMFFQYCQVISIDNLLLAMMAEYFDFLENSEPQSEESIKAHNYVNDVLKPAIKKYVFRKIEKCRSSFNRRIKKCY